MRDRVLIICAFMLAAMFLAACGAAVSIQPTVTQPASPTGIIAVATFTPIPSRTPDAQELMATVIVQAATETRQADEDDMIATQIIRGATETSIMFTLSAPTLDPAQMTATAIVTNATATTSSQLTATSQAVMTQSVLSPDQLTVTAIVEDATATARVAPVTVSQEELDSLHARWLHELESAVGFSHPALETSIDGMVESIQGAIPSLDYARRFHLQPAIIRTEFEGSTYVAVIVVQSRFLWHGFSTLLLFRVTDDVPVLLPEIIHEGWILSFYGPHFSYSPSYSGEFVDFNHNGFPEMILYINDTGNCSMTAMRILELTLDGEFVDIGSDIPVSWRSYWVDINGDNMFELEVMAPVFIPLNSAGCNPLFTKRYYAWDGEAYRDISATLGEAYYPSIERYWDSLDTETRCLVPDGNMYQMLIDYSTLGRFEEGWERLQRVLHWEFCVPDIRGYEQQEMISLVAWVGRNLPEATPSP